MFPKTQGCQNSQNSIQKRQFATIGANGINCCHWVIEFLFLDILCFSTYILSFFFTKNSLSLLIFLINKKEALSFLHKNKFIHSFYFSFPVCLLATCSLLSATYSYICTLYDRTMYVLLYLVLMYLSAFFADLCRDNGNCNWA